MLFNEQDKFFVLLNDNAKFYSVDLPKTTLKFYWDDLKDFSYYDIEAALISHRKAEKYMPKSADLVKIIGEMRSKPQDYDSGQCSFCKAKFLGYDKPKNFKMRDSDKFICSDCNEKYWTAVALKKNINGYYPNINKHQDKFCCEESKGTVPAKLKWDGSMFKYDCGRHSTYNASRVNTQATQSRYALNDLI